MKAKSKSPQASRTRFPLKADLRCGFIFLLLIPFALPGLLITSLYVDLYEWLKVQRWTEVPATLTAIERKSYDDGDTVRAWLEGEFNYSVDEVEYTSDRIFLGRQFPISVSRTVRDLEPRVDQPDAVICFVNFDDPSQAILLRNSGWHNYGVWTMASMIFASIGFAAMLVVIHFWKGERETEIRSIAFPDKPWRWHPSWQPQSITAEASRSFFLMGLCVWWLLSLFPASIVASVEVYEGNWFGLCVLIPFVFVFALLCYAVRQFRFYRLVDQGELALSKKYFQVGATTNAECVFPVQLFPNGDVRTRLSRFELNVGIDDDPYIVIQQKACQIVKGKVRVPVSVSIPAGSPRSTVVDEYSATWKLTVKVPGDRGNYSVKFELPVFDIAEH